MEPRSLELIAGNRNVRTRKFSDDRTAKILFSCVFLRTRISIRMIRLNTERIPYSILFSNYSDFLLKQTVSAYLCERPFKMTCLYRNTKLETVYRSSLYSVRFSSRCLHIVTCVRLVASKQLIHLISCITTCIFR